MEILRSPRSLVVVAEMKNPNDYPEPTKSHAKKTYILVSTYYRHVINKLLTFCIVRYNSDLFKPYNCLYQEVNINVLCKQQPLTD